MESQTNPTMATEQTEQNDQQPFRINRVKLKKELETRGNILVVNGQPVTADGAPLYFYTNRKDNNYIYASKQRKEPRGSEINVAEPGGILDSLSQAMYAFEADCAKLRNRPEPTESQRNQVYIEFDPYTHSIAIMSPTYRDLLYNNAYKSAQSNLSAQQKELLHYFMKRYIVNYYSVYTLLFANTITARVKVSNETVAHLKYGFYRPITVGTPLYPSPFDYQWNSWFKAMLVDNSDPQDVKSYIKPLRSEDNDMTARLMLDCAATCDIAKVFGVPVFPLMKNTQWVYIALSAILVPYVYRWAKTRGFPNYEAWPNLDLINSYPALDQQLKVDDPATGRYSVLNSVLQVALRFAEANENYYL